MPCEGKLELRSPTGNITNLFSFSHITEQTNKICIDQSLLVYLSKFNFKYIV